MKLYHAPLTCSLFPLIVAHEVGVHLEVVRVDLRTKRTEHGDDFLAINHKGKVPALRLPGGELLTEGPVIARYLAEASSSQELVPQAGTRDSVRLLEWLNFLTSDVHKSFGAFFQPTASEEHRAFVRRSLLDYFRYLDEACQGKEYLLGSSFSLADPYLFTILGWTAAHGVDITQLPDLMRFRRRVAQRSAVRAALVYERSGALPNEARP